MGLTCRLCKMGFINGNKDSIKDENFADVFSSYWHQMRNGIAQFNIRKPHSILIEIIIINLYNVYDLIHLWYMNL